MSTTDSNPGGYTSAVRHAAGTTLRCRERFERLFDANARQRDRGLVPDTKSGAPFFETTAGAGSVDSTSEVIRGGLTPRNILFLLGAAIPAFFILAVNKPKIRCRSSEEMLCLARSLFLFCGHLWAMIR